MGIINNLKNKAKKEGKTTITHEYRSYGNGRKYSETFTVQVVAADQNYTITFNLNGGSGTKPAKHRL